MKTKNRFPVSCARTLLAAVATLLLAPAVTQAASGTWNGSTDALWSDVANWTASPVPGTGDTATFSGTSPNTTIDLGGGVTIGNVVFDTSVGSPSPYTIGAGVVGSQTLTVQSGITQSSSVTANQTLNANIALASTTTNVVYQNDSGNTLIVAGTNSAATTGVKSMQVPGAGNVTVSGPIVSGAGSMNLEKLGTGTLTLSGGAYWTGNGVNAYLPGATMDPVVLRSGTTVISGGIYTNNGELTIGGVIANGGVGNNVNFTMNGGLLALTAGNFLSVGRGNGVGGVSSDVVLNNNAGLYTPNGSLGFNGGTGNFPKGSLTLNNNSWMTVNGNFYIAESAGSFMSMTLNNAACFTNLNTAGVNVGRSGVGNLYLNGTGTFYTEGDCVIGYSVAGTNGGTVVVNGGTLKVATTTKRWLQLGRANVANSTGSATLIVNNGTVQLDQNTDLRFASSQSANYNQGTNTLFMEGGNINFYSDNATTIGGTGQLDLMQNGNAAAVNTVNLDGGTITVPSVVSSASSGTRTFNFNGGTLKAAAAAASGSLNFLSLGTGNAVANIRNGGAVIDSNGKNITIAQPLLHSVIAGDAATDGGLTKNGSGALILSGFDTYTGTTRINQGSLNITGSSLNSQSVVLADGATLGVSNPNGTSLSPATMTVGASTGGAVLNLNAVSTAVAPVTPGTLTFTGSGNTINVTGGNFAAGNTYPLIACGSAISGSYVAGTLPAGVTGTISTVGNSIVLSVSAVNITTNIWTGMVSGMWDINTTANWTNSALGNKYTDGSTVQFDDTGINTTTVSNSVLTVLSPGNVVVNNTTKNYCFKTNTIIAGTTGLTKTGTGALTNSTPNTYTGPTVINQGAVVAGVASTANLNGALGLNSAVTLGNDPTAALNLNGFATVIGSLSGGGPNAGNVVLGAGTLTAGLNNSSTAYAGNVSGTGGLTKLGTGTMTITGTNTYSGATTVSQGAVTYGNGAVVISTTNALVVGTVAGFGTATANINSGSSVYFGFTNYIGYLTGKGVLNVNGGTLASGNEFRVGGSDLSGTGPNGYGTLNVLSGTAALNALLIARGNNPLNTMSGEVNVSGGLLISSNDLVMAFAGAGTGKLTISGTGTVNLGTTVTKWLTFGVYDSTSCELDVNGGNLNLNTGSSIKFNTQNSSGTHTINQSAGNVTFYSDYTNTVGGGGNVDLDNNSPSGTTAVNTYNLNGGVLTTPQVASTKANATRTFNFNGGTLRATASSATYFNLGTGNATANVRNGGAIIDTVSNNITIAQPLQHSSIGGDNATDGGLTKQGGGTLTMSGALSYSGPTRVLGGVLGMSAANGLPSGGNLVISNATLNLDASSGTLSVNNATIGYPLGAGTLVLGMNPSGNAISASGNVTLADNTTINLNYGTLNSTPSAAAISASGSLTHGASITINVSAIGLGLGTVPVIVAPGLSSTNGFAIGSLPSGVKGVLTNSVSGELDLLVTSAGQLLTWHGANADNTVVLTNWNINSSSNWYDINSNPAKYLQYSGNTIGDNVIFGDSGYNTTGTNQLNLPVSVVPANVMFSSSSPYVLAGVGGIGGGTSILLTNMSQAVYMQTTNSYTGGTTVASGTLVIPGDWALGAASGPVTLGGGTLEIAGGTTNSRSVTFTANSTIDVVTNVTASLGGALAGAAGLTKTDDGTLILAGTNSITGTLTVNQGNLIASGTNVLAAVPIVGDSSGYNGVLTVAGGIFQDNFNPAQVYNSSLTVGNLAGAAGDMIVRGGTVTIPKQLTIGPTGYGAFSQSGGTATIGGFIALGGNANGGVLNQSGGVINMTNCAATIGYSATTTFGVMNLTGSAVFNITGANNGVWVGEVGNGVLNVSGSAALTIASDGISLGKANAAGNGTVNLNGGSITANFITNGVGVGTFNFNGGTLRANASGSLTRGNLATSFYDYNGGAVMDDGGNTVTFNQPIQAANGYGVASIAVVPGTSSGYVDTPVVTISGGNGSNAMATATVSGGAVTAINITCPGSGYLNGDSLSVNLIGGGANPTAPTIGTFTFVANGTGGLTKQGAGTLSLSGANTYAGPTVVNNGELLVTPASQNGASVVVADGAKFGVTANSVSNSATIGSLTMGSSGATTLDFVYGLGGNPTNVALTAGAVTLHGTSTIHVGGNFALGAFPVLKYSSLSGAFNSAVSAPRGMVATVSNDATHSTIYVVVNSLASAIVWTGNNALPGKANLWDLNTTTNWLIGAVPTTYQEILPPGDAVIFNDLGSGTVLLSNTASPGSVTISNSAVDYTIQGNGQINSVAGLTKLGSGTATLNLPGTYSISTVIAAGTVNLGTNQTFGNLSGSGIVGDPSGTATLTVNNSSNTIFSGTIQGGLGLTKMGNNTLTLTGTNTLTGNVFGKGGSIVVDNGAIWNGTLWTSIGQDGTDNATLTLKGTGMFTNNADFNVGDIGSSTGTLNITNNASLTVASMYIGSANAAGSTASGTVNQSGGAVTNTFLVVGGRASTNGVGVYNLTGGTLADSGTARIGGVGTGTMNISGTASASFASTGISYVGYKTGTGALNMNGGTFNAFGELRVGGSDANGATNIATGTVNLTNATMLLGSLTVARGNYLDNIVSGSVNVGSGSTLISTNDVILEFAGTGVGKVAINGGNFIVGPAATKWFMVGYYDTGYGELDITNGNLWLENGTSIKMCRQGNTGPNVVNQIGGDVTFYSDAGGTLGGGGALDLNYAGAATSSSTYNLNGGVLTVPQIIATSGSGSGVFNFNGGTLKAAASSATFMQGLTAANVNSTAIIDTSSNTIAIGQALLGGGGLTKNGTGVLALNGINTYTGPTMVNAGTLGGSGTIAGMVTVNSGAGIAPANLGGALTINGNLSLNGNSTNTFNVNGTTPANDRVALGSGVTYGGVLNVVPAGTFSVGQTFTLFSGAGATSSSQFSSVQSANGGVAFSFTNGVLTVVSTMATNPTNITASVSGNILTLSWPADHTGWILQAQTNSLSSGLSGGTWFDVAGSTGNNTNIITINPLNPTVFYRLKKP